MLTYLIHYIPDRSAEAMETQYLIAWQPLEIKKPE